MPPPATSAADPAYDISDLVHALLQQGDSDLDVIIAPTKSDPPNVRQALASVNGQSIRFPYRSNPEPIVKHLLRHTARNVTINGRKFDTTPVDPGVTPKPYAIVTRQTGAIDHGDCFRDTDSIGCQEHPFIIGGLHFALPVQWAPGSRSVLDQPPNIRTIALDDPRLDHPNYQATIAVEIFPAYVLDNPKLDEFKFYCINDYPVPTPDAESIETMLQQCEDQTREILAELKRREPNLDVRNYVRLSQPGNRTGHYSVASPIQRCRANIKPHALPAIIDAPDRTTRVTIHDALRLQRDEPIVPITHYGSPSLLKGPYANVSLAYATISRQNGAADLQLSPNDLDDLHPPQGPEESISLRLEIRQDGKPQRTIAVPAPYIIAGHHEEPRVAASKGCPLNTGQLADVIFDTIWDQNDDYQAETALREEARRLAVNALNTPETAFAMRLKKAADRLLQNAPPPEQPVEVSGDGYVLVWQPTG